MVRLLPPFLILVLAWALWSGHSEPLIVSFGVLSCLAVLGIEVRMGRHDGTQPLDYGLALRSIGYLPWLGMEIFKANLDVARRVLAADPGIDSHLIRTRSSQQTELGQVIYANSITLTPGTITLDLRDSGLLVHALTRAAADGVQEGEMDKRVTQLERTS